MKNKKVIALIMCLLMLGHTGIGITTSATELISYSNITLTASIPDNEAPVYDGGNANEVNAADIFHSDDFTGQDETGYAEKAGGILQTVAKFLINTTVYLFAAFLTVYCAVDALVIAFPLAGAFFSTKVPIQLFSNEAATIAGISYSYSSSDSNYGGSGLGSSNSGGSGDTKAKFGSYFTSRGKVLILCGTYLAMTYSGLLTTLLNKAIDFITSLVLGIAN